MDGKAFVVIRMDEDGDHVLVNQQGRELTEEEERWLAYVALPKLERFAFATEEGRIRWLQERIKGHNPKVVLS